MNDDVRFLFQMAVLGGLLCVGIGGFLYPSLVASSKGLGELGVYFLDVGQGDATFIESPSGAQVLIDGGPDSSILRELGSVMGFFDRDIDMIIATHPDKDHIGGLVDVLERYDVGTILVTENKSETPVAEQFLELVDEEGARTLYARAGQIYDLGMGERGSTTLTILFPDREVRGLESNASSIILKLSYGETDFLFTGDTPKSIEAYLVSLYGDHLESEVLKVGHHGSKTPTAETFVSAVDPEYGIVSAGRDNRYGHPHQEVLDTLSRFDVAIKNTAESGSIEITSDGSIVVVE